MINRFVGMGRLVADPELKKTASGVAVTSFKIAIDRDRGGDADFVPCVAWRQTAEFISNYFVKGKLIAVIGELHNREWTDNSGSKHTVTEITVDRAWFCGDKNEKKEKAEVLDDQDDDLPWA